ncbi:hypothetical protein V8C86DRAFT_734268 [Haematococcus lacustris]
MVLNASGSKHSTFVSRGLQIASSNEHTSSLDDLLVFRLKPSSAHRSLLVHKATESPGGRRPPFAAISWFNWLSGTSSLRSTIHDVFERVDTDHSGTASLDELQQFAASQGLPVEYVPCFMSAALQHTQLKPSTASSSQQWSSSSASSASSPCTSPANSSGSCSQLCPATIAAPLTSCNGGSSWTAQVSPCGPTSSPLAPVAPAAGVSVQPGLPCNAPALVMQRMGPACGTTAAGTAAGATNAGISGSSSSSSGRSSSSSCQGTGQSVSGCEGRGEPRDQSLTLEQFEQFIRSRETALRRAFDLFDKDRDGRISAEDLETTLAHVAVCCPRTRCVYRCPRSMAHAMLQRTKAAGQTDGSSVDFPSFRRFFMLLPTADLAMSYWLRAGAAPELTEKMVAVHDATDPPRASAWGHLLAGAVAGAASRTATAPLETLRLAVMTGAVPSSQSLAQAASHIVEQQGWQGLYRGNALNVLRSAPQKALDFFAFDAFKHLLMGPGAGGDGDGGEAPALTRSQMASRTFLAAGLAGMTSWAVLYPLETVRSRVTAGRGPSGASLGALRVLQGILASEGPAALYRGLGWSLAGIFPEAALCYGLHDLLKHTYRQTHGGREPGVLPSLAAGVLSAFTGQLVAFPLETVSRRLQVQRGPGGLPAVVRDVLRQGGPLALYRGVGAATLRLVPMAIVSFGTYEMVRSLLLSWQDMAEAQEAEAEYQALRSACTPLTLTLTHHNSLAAAAIGAITCASTPSSSSCPSAPSTQPCAASTEPPSGCAGSGTSSCAQQGASSSGTGGGGPDAPSTPGPASTAAPATALQPTQGLKAGKAASPAPLLPLPSCKNDSLVRNDFNGVAVGSGAALAAVHLTAPTLAESRGSYSPAAAHPACAASPSGSPGVPCTRAPAGLSCHPGEEGGCSLLPTASATQVASPGTCIVLLPQPITPCTSISLTPAAGAVGGRAA